MPHTCCSVPGCSVRGGYEFPCDTERRSKWIVAVRRGDGHGNFWTPSGTSVVCRAHFVDTDFETHNKCGIEMKKKRLRPAAVPSLFPWTKDTTPEQNVNKPALSAASMSEVVMTNDPPEVIPIDIYPDADHDDLGHNFGLSAESLSSAMTSSVMASKGGEGSSHTASTLSMRDADTSGKMMYQSVSVNINGVLKNILVPIDSAVGNAAANASSTHPITSLEESTNDNVTSLAHSNFRTATVGAYSGRPGDSSCITMVTPSTHVSKTNSTMYSVASTRCTSTQNTSSGILTTTHAIPGVRYATAVTMPPPGFPTSSAHGRLPSYTGNIVQNTPQPQVTSAGTTVSSSTTAQQPPTVMSDSNFQRMTSSRSVGESGTTTPQMTVSAGPQLVQFAVAAQGARSAPVQGAWSALTQGARSGPAQGARSAPSLASASNLQTMMPSNSPSQTVMLQVGANMAPVDVPVNSIRQFMGASNLSNTLPGTCSRAPFPARINAPADLNSLVRPGTISNANVLTFVPSTYISNTRPFVSPSAAAPKSYASNQTIHSSINSSNLHMMATNMMPRAMPQQSRPLFRGAMPLPYVPSQSTLHHKTHTAQPLSSNDLSKISPACSVPSSPGMITIPVTVTTRPTPLITSPQTISVEMFNQINTATVNGARSNSAIQTELQQVIPSREVRVPSPDVTAIACNNLLSDADNLIQQLSNVVNDTRNSEAIDKSFEVLAEWQIGENGDGVSVEPHSIDEHEVEPEENRGSTSNRTASALNDHASTLTERDMEAPAIEHPDDSSPSQLESAHAIETKKHQSTTVGPEEATSSQRANKVKRVAHMRKKKKQKKFTPRKKPKQTIYDTRLVKIWKRYYPQYFKCAVPLLRLSLGKNETVNLKTIEVPELKRENYPQYVFRSKMMVPKLTLQLHKKGLVSYEDTEKSDLNDVGKSAWTIKQHAESGQTRAAPQPQATATKPFVLSSSATGAGTMMIGAKTVPYQKISPVIPPKSSSMQPVTETPKKDAIPPRSVPVVGQTGSLASSVQLVAGAGSAVSSVQVVGSAGSEASSVQVVESAGPEASVQTTGNYYLVKTSTGSFLVPTPRNSSSGTIPNVPSTQGYIPQICITSNSSGEKATTLDIGGTLAGTIVAPRSTTNDPTLTFNSVSRDNRLFNHMFGSTQSNLLRMPQGVPQAQYQQVGVYTNPFSTPTPYLPTPLSQPAPASAVRPEFAGPETESGSSIITSAMPGNRQSRKTAVRVKTEPRDDYEYSSSSVPDDTCPPNSKVLKTSEDRAANRSRIDELKAKLKSQQEALEAVRKHRAAIKEQPSGDAGAEGLTGSSQGAS